MSVRKGILFFCIMTASNPVRVEAGIFSWLGSGFKVVKNFSVYNVVLGGAHKSWESFKYRFGWITPQILRQKQDDLNNNINAQFNQVSDNLHKNIEEVGQKVAAANEQIEKAAENLGQIQEDVAKKQREYQEEQNLAQQRINVEVQQIQQNAEQKNKEQHQALDGFKREIQEAIEQKKREIQILEEQLHGEGGLRKEYENAQQELSDKIAQSAQKHEELHHNVTCNVENLQKNIHNLEVSTQKTHTKLSSLVGELPALEESCNRLESNSRSQQELIMQLGERCSDVAHNHTELMQLIFGLQQKFGIALQFFVLSAAGDEGSQAALQDMRQRYKNLMRLMAEVVRKEDNLSEQPEDSATTALTFRPSMPSCNVYTEEQIHEYLSHMLRSNRLEVVVSKVQDESKYHVIVVHNQQARRNFASDQSLSPVSYNFFNTSKPSRSLPLLLFPYGTNVPLLMLKNKNTE